MNLYWGNKFSWNHSDWWLMLFIYFSITFSRNGWTDCEICEWWFTDQFVPFVMSKHVCDKPILLWWSWLTWNCWYAPSCIWHECHSHCISLKNNTQNSATGYKHLFRCSRPVVLSLQQHVAEGITMNWYNVMYKYLQVCPVIAPEGYTH